MKMPKSYVLWGIIKLLSQNKKGDELFNYLYFQHLPYP